MGIANFSSRLCYTFFMKFRQFLNRWLPVIFWCGLIFLFSSIPTVQTSKIYWWDFVLKKTAHVIEYAVLFFLTFRAVTPTNKKSLITNYSLLITFIFCLLYAITDEYHQSFVPGRHCKAMDIGFDSLGMLISFWRIKIG